MNEIRILMVEDEVTQRLSFSDAVRSYNKKLTDLKLTVEMADSLNKGYDLLSNHYFDYAILDLKLKDFDNDGEGNLLVEEILKKYRIPIFVRTGFSNDLNFDFRDNPKVTLIRKTDPIEHILDEVCKVYSTGVTKILGGKGLLEKYIDKVFWDYVWQDIDYWKSIDPTEAEKAILRYTLSHLNEYLGLSEEQDKFEKYLPVEMYIIPAIKNMIFTGTLLKNNDNGKNYIVLSPACDMAQKKAKRVLMAELENIDFGPVVEQKSLIRKNKSDNEVNEAKENLKKLSNNSYSPRYHFLPRTPRFAGGFINFQKLESIDPRQLDRDFDVIGSISDTFTRDIVSRFSQYYARQGQPDFFESVILSQVGL